MTTTFWIGFMLGACVNALLVIAFTWWQDRKENAEPLNLEPRTSNADSDCSGFNRSTVQGSKFP